MILRSRARESSAARTVSSWPPGPSLEWIRGPFFVPGRGDPEDPECPEDPEDPEDPENPENPEEPEYPERPENQFQGKRVGRETFKISA